MRENTAPRIISSDDVIEEYPILNSEPFDYDAELYDDEIREFEDEEVLRVNALDSEADYPDILDGPIVTGTSVPVIYEDSLNRTAKFVNGQFQYRVTFTVTDVPGAVDYEVRVSEA